MPRVLVTTVPFASENKLPLDLLESRGIEYLINPLNRKLKEKELIDLVKDFDAIIAGTEPITAKVLEAAPSLKIISRVGIGLDSVDLLEAKNRKIASSYTPDAPAPAVAEITIGLMLSLLRYINIANSEMHEGKWNRYYGRRIPEITLGIIGVGRIGGRVLRRLSSFGSPRVLVNDIEPKENITEKLKLEWVDKETIYKKADLISLHLPLTNLTKNMITYDQLKMMKSDAMIINTSRGGIINENDLAKVLREPHLSGAAIDVFENEPYSGDLKNIKNCLLTSHMGSMSLDCRSKMEIEAVEEVVRFFTNKPLKRPVPEEEYELKRNY